MMQTGSGKTYTMGTGIKDGTKNGLIPQVMSALFNKIDSVKHQMGFQLHVSFIEILKEEVLDLLDSSVPFNRLANGTPGKVVLSKSPVQIRESPNGVITLSGATEVPIATKEEMASCLEQGSLTRATGSTNMNNESSRSHAIFTITLEQMRKISSISVVKDTVDEDMGEEYCCAKLHLVDLAGSERAKRTGSGGVRLKEGIHINRGLLALGNVISALGDEKRRKEGAHVPYRDSKLTRLLQDSLGGNSKTVMIACISPADINAEETLNTLKYANRARNIQNKPVANKDLICSEMQKMRQELQYLQATLCARGATSSEEVQVMREKIMKLESANEELSRELHIYRSKRVTLDYCNIDAQEDGVIFSKDDGLKRGFESMDSDYEMSEATSGGISEDIGAAEEWEHALRQNSMGKELNELSKRLEEKESEMRVCGIGTETIRQHFEKKMMELEKEKRTVQDERDMLLAEVEELAASSDRQAQVARDNHAHKLKALETQILNLKKKQENQVEVLKQKQKSEDAAKRLKTEIQCIKAQKVQLQQKMKQEAEQFRQWKASQEKELLQLKKEGRKTEHERLKLEALNRRQKMVLQRKTEEAAMATKRLKELLEARKSSPHDISVIANGQPPSRQTNEKSLRKWLDNELEVMAKVHQVRFQYEKQIQVRAALAVELTSLRQEMEFPSNSHQEKNGQFRFLSPNTRLERIASLESMLDVSSNALTAMGSQLSEAEEREHSLHAKPRWNHIQSMTDAKYLLQYVFDSTAEARSKIWEKDRDIKEKKEQLNDLLCLLQLTEVQNREILKEKKTREQTVSIALASTSSSYSGSSRSSSKHYGDNNASDDPSSPSSTYHRATKHLKYTGPGIVNISVRESEALLEETRKMKAMKKMGQSGKLWKWKRSHHQWLLQFKWKWQKPWKLSEWIKQNDETTMHVMSKSHHDDEDDHSWNRHSMFQGA
ncbi:ATP binding microtubule motor family protein [Arabidopsis thaliana]|uniref:Kinesin-like protein n=2 Tax=Arabidopsis thaliana TaxID=3702 RepID=A0A178VII2_ARATH|nr:ATP binding microtubule motor family protein [Arabidopsis thaliana]ANM64485.1 ATP binding microtubule motor family protein [Arabidopsis thaliana]OAP05125.1 KICP-02 [Arabidopsis thaliana]|eukprot:NP_001326510.1 ATP binding microtubule motor family protein [Arabidopsis thaliana]